MVQHLERLLATGRQLSESGRTQAQQLRPIWLIRDARQQIRSAVVEQLVNPVGRYRGEDWRETVHAEVQQVVRSLRSETKEDLATQSQAVADQIAAAVEDLRDARVHRRVAQAFTELARTI